MSNARIEGLRKAMAREGVGCFFTECEPNVQYLSGFPGEDAGLLVTADEACLVLDGRFTAQAAESVPDFPVLARQGSLARCVAAFARERSLSTLACEGNRLVVDSFQRLQEACEGCEVIPLSGVVERLRSVKDEGEVAAIERACVAAAQGLAAVRPAIRPGVSEKEVADLLEKAIRATGAERTSFEMSVLGGERSAQPHGQPGARRLAAGEILLIDFGARVDAYLSDLTRVLFVSSMDDEWKRLYSIVLEAQERAIAAVAPGRPLSDVDRAAREHIEEAGLGDAFFHAVGHGVGREIHEAPGVGAKSTRAMEPGMVFTIEPGVYFPGRGGVRIEDMVVVEDGGGRVLSSALPKGLDTALLGSSAG